MAKQPQGEAVLAAHSFDYASLSIAVAERLRMTAGRIRERVKRTLGEIIEVGNDLLAVKDSLPHGQFGAWLRAEFGWTERTARNFMAVAEQFGSKTEIISDSRIAPTAAYLLAAPSAPAEARETAVARAQSGEVVTTAVAKEILASARKKRTNAAHRASARDLSPGLVKVLERYRQRWNPKELLEMARQLREFADALDEQRRGRR